MTVEAMRPMSLGEILDRTFQIYRARFWVFAGIAALLPAGRLAIALVLEVFNLVVGQTTLGYSTKVSLKQVDSGLPAKLLTYLASMLIVPAISYAASMEFLHAKPTIHASISKCAARWRSWLVYSGVAGAVVYGVPAALNGVGVVERLHRSARLALMRGQPLAGLPGGLMVNSADWLLEFGLSAMLILSAPAWVLEELPTGKAIRRGFQLAKGSVTRIFAAWCLKNVVWWVLAAAPPFIFLFLFRMIPNSAAGESLRYGWYRAMIITTGYVATTFAGPIYPIAITLFYYDQRIRKEGYDIEHLMDAAGLNAGSVPVAMVAQTSQAGDSVEAEVPTG